MANLWHQVTRGQRNGDSLLAMKWGEAQLLLRLRLASEGGRWMAVLRLKSGKGLAALHAVPLPD